MIAYRPGHGLWTPGLNLHCSERYPLARKPDFVLILAVAFGLGVVLTLLLPMAANDTEAAPASELHAGVIIRD